jgi:hypothetical protein
MEALPIDADIPRKLDSHFDLKAELGKGACGAVYLYQKNVPPHQKIAVKMESMSPNVRNKVLGKEIYQMKQLNEKCPIRGPNGMKRFPECYGDTFGGDYHCMKFEYLEYSVPEYLQKIAVQDKMTNQRNYIDIFTQMLESLQDMHEALYVH